MGFGLKGIAVTVLLPTDAETGVTGETAYDPFGAPVPGVPGEVAVANVLVDRPTDQELEQTTRQYGAACDLTLHFPKAFHGSLRGCSVVLPAPWSDTFKVLGDPLPYDPRLTPGAHNRPVHVRRVVG